MKRLLSLTALLLLAIASFAHDFYSNGIYYTIISSTSTPPTVSVSYRGATSSSYSNEYTGSLTIPETVTYSGKTYTVTSIGYYAFSGCSGLKSVTIPSSVTSIDMSAFDGCTGLTSVTIPSSVTTIGYDAFRRCIGLTSVTIPSSVTSIGSSAFSGCSGLTSVIIPDGITSIGSSAFSGCSGLTSITIPEGVTSIGGGAFENCSGLTSVTIPSSVTSIGSSAFDGTAWYNNQPDGLVYAGKVTYTYKGTMPNSTSIVLEEGTLGIAGSAFANCSGLTSITIPSSVTTIGSSAFANCSGLANITIPSSVTSIGSSAFRSCSGLTSITIPKSITSIDGWSFSGCSGLTSVTIPSSVTSIGNQAFSGCSGLTSVTIPSSVTTIGYGTFYGCSNLTSITIPSSVTSIGDEAFSGTEWYNNQPNGIIYINNTLYGYKGTMPANTSIEIKEGTASIGGNAFANCSGLTSITIPSSVTSIGGGAFENCSGLTSVTIPSSVTSIGEQMFNGCTALTDVSLNCNYIASRSLKNIFGTQVETYTLGDDITSISSYAFSGCNNLTSLIILGDDINLDNEAFLREIKLYVKKGSNTLLRLWNQNYINIYDVETNEPINLPSLSLVNATQATLEVKINNMYGEYKYKYEGNVLTDDVIYVKGLKPDYSKSFRIYITLDKDYNYSLYENYTTIGINPVIVCDAMSASSIHAKGSHTNGDATIVKETFKYNNKEVDGEDIIATGLTPNTSYEVTYSITVAYGDNNQYTASYTDKKTVKTQELTLTTEQPKVVSMGNVIVSATTNVDPEEQNVGFEWRREDWSSTFASQSGNAVIYDNTMEGYIRNLNTDKLWNYRAYYLSDSGTYYYGDWVGIDPTNTSYFEPTVHTYADISTSGKVALIRGYVLNGTDKVTVQGFKYWKTANKGNSLDIAMEGEPQAAVVSVPADAITETVDIVGAGQQLMKATLNNLDYGSTYQCVAFATTSENETFYGEVQSFTTEADPTGIEGVKEDASSSKPVTVVACYDINGKCLSQPQKGLNILRMSDGTTRKVVR